MPEEFPGPLRGGVGWGLGTLFAGQGDNPTLSSCPNLYLDISSTP